MTRSEHGEKDRLPSVSLMRPMVLRERAFLDIGEDRRIRYRYLSLVWDPQISLEEGPAF
jgi:hypothetical protein